MNARIALAPLLVGLLAATATAGPITDVSEIGGYTRVYQVDIQDNDSGNVGYLVDNSGASLGAFDRIGYYLELEVTGSNNRQWVWASMDAFTGDLSKIGVPTLASGANWQMIVDDMNVESNVAGIVTGTGITTGNIEFWPNDYGGSPLLGLPGATNNYDYDDTQSPIHPPDGNYGSMQIHNHGAGQTLLAYNAWGRSGWTDELEIGNRSSGHPDWTFAANAPSYSLRNLEVWVTATPEPSSAALFGLGGLLYVSRRRRSRK